MPELASLKPSGLPTTAFQPISPSSYFDRRVPDLVPSTTAASELASQTAVASLVAKAVGDLPNLITTNLLKGGETRNKLQGQKIMGQVLGGTPLSPLQRGALSDTKIDSSGTSTLNPDSPAEIAYKQALAGKAKQQWVNDTPILDRELDSTPGVRPVRRSSGGAGGALGEGGTLDDTTVDPQTLVDAPMPSQAGALAEPKTGALAPDTRPIWERDINVSNALDAARITGDQLLEAKRSPTGELIVTDLDGSERTIPKEASGYLIAEQEKEKTKQEEERAKSLDTSPIKTGALAEGQSKVIDQDDNTVTLLRPDGSKVTKLRYYKPGESNILKIEPAPKAAGVDRRTLKKGTLDAMDATGYNPVEGETEQQIRQHARELGEAKKLVPVGERQRFTSWHNRKVSDPLVTTLVKARHGADIVKSAIKEGLNAADALAIIDPYVTTLRGGAATKGNVEVITGSQPYIERLQNFVDGFKENGNTKVTEKMANDIKVIVDDLEKTATKHLEKERAAEIKHWSHFGVPEGPIIDSYDRWLEGDLAPIPDTGATYTADQGATTATSGNLGPVSALGAPPAAAPVAKAPAEAPSIPAAPAYATPAAAAPAAPSRSPEQKKKDIAAWNYIQKHPGTQMSKDLLEELRAAKYQIDIK